MKIISIKKTSTRLAILALALMGMFAIPSSKSQASTPWRVASVPLAGVSGGNNNIAFAFERFALVAPYAPANSVDENSSLKDFDNHFIYLVDTRKPAAGVTSVSLESATGNNVVYYPTKVLFDAASSIVYVRGTRYEQKEDGVEPIEAIAYVRLNLDDNGKPAFNSNVTVIDIRGVGSESHTSDAPIDFALGQNGKLLVFTNGASIFSYNLEQGYVYQVDIVPQKDFNEDSKIAYLDADPITNTVTVCWNRKLTDDAGAVRNTSELSFYDLSADGAFFLNKRVYPEQFAEGIHLVAGSGAVITSNGDSAKVDSAYFVTSDGALCQVDLSADGVSATIKQIHQFDELAQGSVEDASPRVIKFDSAKKIIGIVKQGFTAQIKRPTNGRPNRPIIRSLNTFKPIEAPAVALVKLGKKNKFISSNLFISDFSEEEGLTNFVPSADGQWLISSHSGNLFSVGIGGDPQKADLRVLAQLGPRTDYLAFCEARSSVVAINSFEPNEDGNLMMTPGSLTVAKMTDLDTQVGSLSVQSVGSSSKKSSGKQSSPGLLIRRPCNDKKMN